ncbi:TenA family protein [Marinobacterium aestuariivivens]|uniref:Aminopyrimidine aminohydrolase n=1 Tax=Marinobacterium aestuariivivens TaxID=1698799 RepID=A0ABW2A179_9GAMM
MTQPFSEQLRAAAEPWWSGAVEHRFTAQLGDDVLSDEIYSRYLLQDYAFVGTLADHVARTLAAAPDMAAKGVLAAFLAALTSAENDYFERSFAALGIAPDEYRAPKLNPVAQLLAREMQDAQACGYADMITVLACAEWAYLRWAKLQAIKTPPQRFWLREWIDIHVLPEFEQFVAWLRGQLDGFASLDEADRLRLHDRFTRMAWLEQAFFDVLMDD